MTETTAYTEQLPQQEANQNSSFLPLEFIRPAQASKIFSVSRSIIYDLMNEGLIRSINLTKKGSVKGARLISYPSIRNYFKGLEEEQNQPVIEGGQA